MVAVSGITRKKLGILLLLLFIFSGMVSCSSGRKKMLVIGSAASLSGVMKALTLEYEKQHRENIKLYSAASGIIAAQIKNGADVDLFIPADISYMQDLEQSGLVLESSIICRNSLVFARKLTGGEIQKIGIGNPDYVPAGRYAVKLLEHRQDYSILKRKFIYGVNVSQVLRWLESGNVDAAYMYRTDAALYSNIHVLKEWVSISGQSILYPAMVVRATKYKTESLEFLAFLSSGKAQGILRKYGFRI